MSNGNDEGAEGAMILASILAVVMVIAMAMAVAMTVAAFVLTLVALAAWEEPLTIGDAVIEPEEAQEFVARGVVGAVIVPLSLALCSLFGGQVDWSLWPWFLIGGYVAGSVGVEILTFEEKQAAKNSVVPFPPLAPPSALPSPPPEPFRFADWDDEEELS